MINVDSLGVISDTLNYPVHVLDKQIKDSTDLLLITDANKSHYVYITGFNKFMCHKTKQKKNTFEDIVCSVLVVKKSWYKRFKAKQSVKLRNGFIKLNNYSKQLAVLFKNHVDFESVLKGVWSDRSYSASCTKKYEEHISCNFACNANCIGEFSKPVIFYKGKNTVNKFIKTILKEYRHCRSVVKKHFNKQFVITVDERSF